VDNRPTGAPALSGRLKIKLLPGSLAYNIYQKTEIEEAFNCGFELNPAYQQKLESAGLKVTGKTADGGARIVELPENAFYIGTGFIPQLSSEVNKPHPLIVAFLQAAVKYTKR
jgi:CTP synthase